MAPRSLLVPGQERGRVVITGAAGFVGHHMVAHAAEAGFNVRATDVSSRHYGAMFDALGVEFVRSDLTKRDNLGQLLEGVDSVFHIAGIHDYSTPDKIIFAVNRDGVENLCDASTKAGVQRFIHFSAAGVHGYNSNPGNQVKEDDPKQTEPLNNYFVSKWEGEKVVHKYIRDKGLRATIFRPGGLYGPRAEYGVFNMFQHVYQNRHKKQIMMAGRGDKIERGSHIEDVCQAVLFAHDHDEMIGEAYFHSDASTLTTLELFQLISRELLGEEKVFFPTPVPVVQAMAGVSGVFAKLTGTKTLLEKAALDYTIHDKCWDGSKLRDAGFEFKYLTMEQGIKDTLRWYKDNGWF